MGNLSSTSKLGWIPSLAGIVWLTAAVFACTEPAQREQLRVELEADRAVRDLVVEVSVEVEYSSPTGGWRSLDAQRFEPPTRHPWPIEYSVPTAASRSNYQVLAVARDDRSAVVARARAVRDHDAAGRLLLRLVFERECIRRAEQCSNGETCHDGACVDARLDTSEIVPNDAPLDEVGPSTDAGPDPGGPMIAGEGEPCSPEGARACAGEGTRAPLVCQAGVWEPSPLCAEAELCDTGRGSTRGTCRKVKPECVGRALNSPFCDRETMRVCTSMFATEPRECGDNMRCAAPDGNAECECRNGLIEADDGTGCREPTNCAIDNGGCDPLTVCSMSGSGRVCSACPADQGYVGTGDTGCEPLLAGLTVSAGQLTPAFQPGVHAYRVQVPLLAQRVTFTPMATAQARIELNGNAVAPGQAWATPVLPLGEFPVTLALTSASGATSTYEIVLVREGAQRAYLKAHNAGAGDLLGTMIAMSGDTLVAGAPDEDGGGAGVDAAPDDKLSAAGAAYVFVRRADGRWEQQAYLKPKEPMETLYFGWSVGISGDTIVLGAPHNVIYPPNSAPGRPGYAYVFTRTQGTWSETARLKPSTTSDGDWFGFNVAIEGDTLVVTAPRDPGNGAAYIYERIGGEWREQRKVRPSPGAANATFGAAVAVSRGVIVVGAGDEATEMSGAGAAYVYTRGAGEWAQTQRLTADPIASNASYGYAVAMRGDHLLIGAPRILSVGTVLQTSPGEVFAYRKNGASWVFKQRIRAILPRESDSFGTAIAMTEDAAVIGSAGEMSGDSGVGADASRRDARYSGAGYLLAREGDVWKTSTYVKAQHPDTADGLGIGATMGDGVAVFSANWESSAARGIDGDQRDNSADRAGALYVFE